MFRDKLFLLSESEVDKYLPTEGSRKCKFNGGMYAWWTRSPGYYGTDTAYVDYLGYLHSHGACIDYDDVIRPALHINPAVLKTLLEFKENDCVRFGGRDWMVLNEESGLLLSKEAVAQHFFDTENADYEQSEIRAYMNGELLNEMFTKHEQSLIVDTVIVGDESYPAKQDDLISRKEVLCALENVFDEHKMSYGEQYGGFAAEVPKAIKAIPAACVAETVENAGATKEVCNPEYLEWKSPYRLCRDARCSCGNVVKSYQNYCDACGNELEWGQK